MDNTDQILAELKTISTSVTRIETELPHFTARLNAHSEKMETHEIRLKDIDGERMWTKGALYILVGIGTVFAGFAVTHGNRAVEALEAIAKHFSK